MGYSLYRVPPFLSPFFITFSVSLHALFIFIGAVTRWSIYLALLSAFHFAEWYITVVYRPKEVSADSWVINHSKAYTIAQIAATVEYWVVAAFSAFMPSLSTAFNLPVVSLLLLLIDCLSFLSCLMAMFLRILSMVTAGDNFSHRVMTSKESQNPQHHLVTTGLYAYLRHPSYFGWFYWAVCSQVFLRNVCCSVGFFLFSVKFFSNRIVFEEGFLMKIYGKEYETYAEATPIGIPFVRTLIKYKGRQPMQKEA